MKYSEIIAKMLKGEELTEAERKFMEAYKDPKGDDSRTAELQKQLDKAKADKEELEKKIEEAEGKDKTEVEKLQAALDKANGKVKAAEAAAEAVKTEKAALEHENAISALAAEHKFTDREFLKFKFQSGKIDPRDAEAAKTFIENLKKDSPKYFTVDVNTGGAGTGGGDGGAGTGKDKKAEWEELMKKDNPTPVERSRRMELAVALKKEQDAAKAAEAAKEDEE